MNDAKHREIDVLQRDHEVAIFQGDQKITIRTAAELDAVINSLELAKLIKVFSADKSPNITEGPER
jgi:hypothetical protein